MNAYKLAASLRRQATLIVKHADAIEASETPLWQATARSLKVLRGVASSLRRQADQIKPKKAPK